MEIIDHHDVPLSLKLTSEQSEQFKASSASSVEQADQFPSISALSASIAASMETEVTRLTQLTLTRLLFHSSSTCTFFLFDNRSALMEYLSVDVDSLLSELQSKS